MQGRPLPNSLDAEQGLLAACIVDSSGEVIGRCMEQSISSDHFYDQAHQLIYDGLLALHKENLEADEILLSDKLSDLGNLERVGGRGIYHKSHIPNRNHCSCTILARHC